jgi:hypothetical protein
MQRPLRNHSCQIPKLRSPTETAATVPAIIAWVGPSAPGPPTKGLPDRKNRSAEAHENADATELAPDLQYGILRIGR